VLLLGSVVVAVIIVVLAIAATGVAIAIKPTATQQAVRVAESVPGKFLPIMPGQSAAQSPSDDDYLPKVVSITDQLAGAVPPMVASNGPKQAVAQGWPTVAPSTSDVPPPPLALPPGGLDLNDWLPPWMNSGDLSAAFPQAAACTPGDSTCFVKATGCKPGDVQCLNAMYAACRSGSPTCPEAQVNQPVAVAVPPAAGPTERVPSANLPATASATTTAVAPPADESTLPPPPSPAVAVAPQQEVPPSPAPSPTTTEPPLPSPVVAPGPPPSASVEPDPGQPPVPHTGGQHSPG
jgi:hypothetical protein